MNMEGIQDNAGNAQDSQYDSVIDALPYIDQDYDQDVVTKLITQETRTNTLHKTIPQQEPIFTSSPALSSLFASKKPLNLPDPSTNCDTAAFVAYQDTRILNLELMNKFAGTAWRIHNHATSADVDRVKALVLDVRAQIDSVNAARRADQTQALPTLTSLQQRYNELVQSILAVRHENDALDAEIRALEVAVGGSGTK